MMPRGAAKACILTALVQEQAFGIRIDSGIEDLSDESTELSADTSGSAMQGFSAGIEMSQQGELDADFEALGLGSDDPEKIRQAVVNGKALEKQLNCEKISEKMPAAIVSITEKFHPACGETSCDFSAVNGDGAFMAQQVVVSLVAAADQRKCLPQVLGSPLVQEKITDYLSFVKKVLGSAPSTEGRSRVQEAYLQLVAYQQGVPALAAGLKDRKLLHSERVCPAVCQMCDQRGSGAFGFRCLILVRDRDENPFLASGQDLSCSAPEKRGWWRRYRYSRQCTVPDWKESAMQHVHVAAAVACAGESILMSVRSKLTAPRRRELYELCLASEQGNAISARMKQNYEDQGKLMDDSVPRELRLALNSILTVGLASGLASLRQATRGNTHSVLLESGAVDFAAPFVKHIVGLEVPKEDVALYGDREHFRQAETLARLESCEKVYSMKAENTFVEGAKAVSIDSMAAMQTKDESSFGKSVRKAAKDVAWYSLFTLFGGILAFMFLAVIGIIVFTVVFGIAFGADMAGGTISVLGYLGMLGTSAAGGVGAAIGTWRIFKFARFLATLIVGGNPENGYGKRQTLQIEKCMRSA